MTGGTGRPGQPVAVITDSAASLPTALTDELGVVVTPMTLEIGGQVVPDGCLDASEVARRVAGEHVTTSAPSPGAFLQALEKLGGRPALIATVSQNMSATYEAAVTAARYLSAGAARVVDTGTAAGAQGLVVLAAARAAAGGASLDEVADIAGDVARRVHLMAALDNLDQLARSGRVPGIAARAGRSMALRALFEFEAGDVRRRLPAIGWRSALGRILAACAASAPDGAQGSRLHAAVLDAHAPDEAEELTSMLTAAHPDADVFAAPFSSVMVAHTGPGLVGLGWWWQDGDQRQGG